MSASVDYPLVPYKERSQRSAGQCGRCGAIGHVIESIQGGWVCWSLGYCNVRRPFPKPGPWNPPADIVDPEWRRAMDS